MIHVSDLLESKGPRAFCSREQVLGYWTNRMRVGGKLTPGRRLLFARGEFEGQEIVNRFLRTSVYGGSVYARWSCPRGANKHDTAHDQYIGLFADARERKCKCGLFMRKHNEIDLELPSLLLTGHPDMIIFHNGRYYVYEYKSIDRADVSFDEIVTPLASHRLQISFYYKIMQALDMPVSRRLTVMYVDRSNSKIWGGLPYKEIPIKPESEAEMTKFKNRLLHVKHGIETKKLPDRICPTIRSERAKACPYAVECFERRQQRVS